MRDLPEHNPKLGSSMNPLRLDVDAIADSAQGIGVLKVNQPGLRICWRAAQRQDEQHFYECC